MPADVVKKTFEDSISEIERVLKLHIGKWKLNGLAWMDKDDVKQIILAHIYKKWHLYKQEMPLGNWLTRVICHKLLNLTRDHYYKFSSVCVGCPSNIGGGICKLYGTVSSDECRLYKNWECSKSQQYNINLPVSLENHVSEINNKPFTEIDIEKQLAELKVKLAGRLTPNQFKIFEYIYLDNLTDVEILGRMKFSNKTNGMKEIKSLKLMIIPFVKNLLANEEMF